MIRELEVLLGLHAVTGLHGIAGQIAIFLKLLLGVAANLGLGLVSLSTASALTATPTVPALSTTPSGVATASVSPIRLRMIHTMFDFLFAERPTHGQFPKITAGTYLCLFRDLFFLGTPWQAASAARILACFSANKPSRIAGEIQANSVPQRLIIHCPAHPPPHRHSALFSPPVLPSHWR